MPAVVEPEEARTGVTGAGSAKGEQTPTLLTDFEQIYQGGAASRRAFPTAY